MKDQTKIQLSSYEMELVNNADVILTKNTIMQKARLLLENLQSLQQENIQSHRKKLPAEVFIPSPKISKGENYKGLPYFVLDHPRYFDKDNIFAIRTMFWWGNFFSITLHLSGQYKKKMEKKIISSHLLLVKNDFYICTQDNEWEHHFETDNYIPVSKLNKNTFETLIQKKPFIKLAQKISLNHWNDMRKILISKYQQINVMLTT
jgi:hypothetical protein